jgi:hypothetical protein
MTDHQLAADNRAEALFHGSQIVDEMQLKASGRRLTDNTHLASINAASEEGAVQPSGDAVAGLRGSPAGTDHTVGLAASVDTFVDAEVARLSKKYQDMFGVEDRDKIDKGYRELKGRPSHGAFGQRARTNAPGSHPWPWSGGGPAS